MGTRTRPARKARRQRVQPLSLKQIEAGIAAWDRDKILDFALEAIHHDSDLMAAAEGRIRRL